MNADTLEQKWRDKWEKAGIFCAEPSRRKKKYVTAAFPYPNSPQHIGHARTYTTADIYARYLRLKGFNVLFPMAFHVTGTPILAMAKRVAKKDPEIMKVFGEIYGIPEKTSEGLTDPVALVTYFSREIEEGMKEMGFSIDWRRKFYTFDRRFNAFIQWQFRKLKALGYLVKGEYPIAWCQADGNAVSAHDTKGDVDPELEEVTIIAFPVIGSEHSLVVATYRPETIYGVTNIWINPKARYVKAKCHGRAIILAKAAAEMLKLQMALEVLEEIDADSLTSAMARNPVTGEEVPVLTASFVSGTVGTGIVMGVPAHAPYDYLALHDLGKADIKMPLVLAVPGQEGGEIPAKAVVERMRVKSQDDPLAEEATKELYTKEAHDGVMLTGRYKGMKAIEAKERIAEDLKRENNAFTAITIANGPVFCRCGSGVTVNILKDQWFLDYGISEWKEKARQCLGSMQLIPEKTREEYLYTIGWLKTRPCTRAAGLGTRFPFDETKIIEALSDSTVYMAYYTVAHMLDNFSAEEFDEAFFDAVFLGTGHKTQDTRLKELRRSFLYWYPVDSRHSAGDLIRNHLTLYIFAHTAVFGQKLWPRQIVTNGFVLMDGTKMSKSMGNILPLRRAIQEYGADVVRFSVVSGADLTHDTDFNKTVAEGTRSRLAFIASLVENAAGQKRKKAKAHSPAGKWLLSRLNRRIGMADELYGKCMLRPLALEIFYDVLQDLKWHEKRGSGGSLRPFFEKWLPLIAPFMPYHAEEFWEKLGFRGFVSSAPFPKADAKAVAVKAEQGEELVRAVYADIEKIATLLRIKPKVAAIYVAAGWKYDSYSLVRELKAFDMVMQKAAQSKNLKAHMQQLQPVVKQLMKHVHSLPDVLGGKEELSALRDAIPFFKKEFGCELSVEIEPEQETENIKHKLAMPGKPAIVLS